MTKEKRIDYLNKIEHSKEAIQNSAKSVVNGVPVIYGGTDNLSHDLFEYGSALYFAPTEELRIKDIVKDSSDFATVLASGDFALDAINSGVKNVLTFDINELQYYVASLKLSALQNLKYSEYYTFLHDSSDVINYLSENNYIKLKNNSNSSPEVYYFFDVLFKKLSEASDELYQILVSNFFINYTLSIDPRTCSKDMYFKYISEKLPKLLKVKSFPKLGLLEIDNILSILLPEYSSLEYFDFIHGDYRLMNSKSFIQNDIAFNNMKEKIKNSNINFIKSDVLTLKDSLETVNYLNNSFKGFQAIYLSNIPEYIDGDKFTHAVDTQLMPLLKDDGIIVYCCQGFSKKTLSVDTKELERLEKSSGLRFDKLDTNPFVEIQLVNDIKAYSLLSERYAVDVDEVKNYGSANGIEDTDTFIYIKKR